MKSKNPNHWIPTPSAIERELVAKRGQRYVWRFGYLKKWVRPIRFREFMAEPGATEVMALAGYTNGKLTETKLNDVAKIPRVLRKDPLCGIQTVSGW